jgi:hypothetical protein
MIEADPGPQQIQLIEEACRPGCSLSQVALPRSRPSSGKPG